VVQRFTVPGRSRATVRCRVNCSEISDLGVVEGALGAVQLANSLNRLDEQEGVLGPVRESFHAAGKIAG